MKSFYGLALAFLMLISVCYAGNKHNNVGAGFMWGHEDDDARVRVEGSG